MKKLIPFILLASIIGLLVFTLMPKAQTAPSFTLTDLNQQTISNHDFQQRLTLINFWFPSCPGCASEMPKLIQMAKHYQNTPFQIIGIAVPVDSPEAVQAYVAQHQLPFRVAYDHNKTVTQQFIKTELFPTSILINQKGEIVKTFVGEPDFTALYQEIDQAIQK